MSAVGAAAAGWTRLGEGAQKKLTNGAMVDQFADV